MRVVFIQKFVPHYRLPFHERVRDELKSRGIEFKLVYGQPDPYEGSKVKMEHPSWGTKVKSKIFKVAGRYLYWQGAPFQVRKDDLVVAEHAAKLLDNYLLFAMCQLKRIHFGYFGHGENFQTKHELAVSRWVKKKMLINVSMWFAYTDISQQSLIRQGMPQSKITVVNNTLLEPEGLDAMPDKVPGRLLYIGGLYADKRLDLILEGFVQASLSNPSLELHVVGDGPQRDIIEAAAAEHSKIVYHGSLYGAERNEMLASSEAILMPGLVGLVAVDSFFFRTPILSSHAGQHSPEVAYLQHGENAMFDSESGDSASFGKLVSQYFDDEALKARLVKGCQNSADKYNMENMVLRFCDGVEAVFHSQA